MPDAMTSRSCATMRREYQLIGSMNIGDRAISLYLHNERHHAVAVYEQPEDVNGQLRHRHLVQLDLKVRGKQLLEFDRYVTSLVETTGAVDALRAAIADAGFTLLSRCPVCGSLDVKRDTRAVEYEHKGYKTTVPGITGDFCDGCGEAVLDDDACDKYGAAIVAFKREIDARLDAEIDHILTRHGRTIDALADR